MESYVSSLTRAFWTLPQSFLELKIDPRGQENRGDTKIFASGGLGNYLAQPGLVGTDIRPVELPVVSQQKSVLPNDCELIIAPRRGAS